eukprot:7330362-Pyramimonas_sp.AAC.1
MTACSQHSRTNQSQAEREVDQSEAGWAGGGPIGGSGMAARSQRSRRAPAAGAEMVTAGALGGLGAGRAHVCSGVADGHRG